MNAFCSMIKRWDIILILILIFLSFLPFIIFSYLQNGIVTENSINVAVISFGSQEMERITLTGNVGKDVLNLPEIDCDPYTVEINDNQIRIISSTCPEQICVRTGYISKPGQTIVCLPHKVILEIETDAGNMDELIISS